MGKEKQPKRKQQIQKHSEPAKYLDCVICGKKTNHVEIFNGKRIPVHKTECAGKLKEQELQKIGLAFCVYCKKQTLYKDLRCTICGNARISMQI